MIASHMRQIRNSGAGVLILSWYPPGLADENGLPSDDTVMPVMEAAHAQGLKLCILVEPYEGLNATNFRKHLEYASVKYVSHPAYYKHRVGRRELPVFYLYDSYRVRPEEWQRVFSR